MGSEVEREASNDDYYARFSQRLHDCLEVLRAMLARPGLLTLALADGTEHLTTAATAAPVHTWPVARA